MYVKVSLLSIKDRQVDVLEESYQNIHFGSEKLFGTKFLKYVVTVVLSCGSERKKFIAYDLHPGLIPYLVSQNS